MRTVSRLSLVLAVAAASVVTLAPLVVRRRRSTAPTRKSKKLVTITIDNTDTTGWLVIERELGTTRIGYTAEGDVLEGLRRRANRRQPTRSRSSGRPCPRRSTSASRTARSHRAPRPRAVVSPRSSSSSTSATGTDSRDAAWAATAPTGWASRRPAQATLNGDSDVDVTISGVDRWEHRGRDGNDVLDGRGAPPVRIYGGEGADRLTGGAGPDDLYGDDDGEPGRQRRARSVEAADDDLYGYLGNDTLIGGDGDDSLYGYEGRDTAQGRGR